MKLIAREKRRKSLKKFTFVGHGISLAVCGAYLGVPEELRKELPALWIAGTIFVVNIWAGIGNFVDQSGDKP